MWHSGDFSFQHPRTTFDAAFNQRSNKRRQDLANVLAILKGSSGEAPSEECQLYVHFVPLVSTACLISPSNEMLLFIFKFLLESYAPFVSGDKNSIFA